LEEVEELKSKGKVDDTEKPKDKEDEVGEKYRSSDPGL